MNSLIHVLRSQASNNLGYGRANRVKLPFGVIAVNCAAKYFSTPCSPLGPLLYQAKYSSMEISIQNRRVPGAVHIVRLPDEKAILYWILYCVVMY